MKTAMLLAAGRGERLKPITNHIPKVMCPVLEKPLIEHHVTRLAHAGFERIVINHAYLGGQIRQHLGDGKQWGVEICYAPEPPGGLETGGGIYNALSLLGKESFLAVNADIFTDFDFNLLKLDHDAMIHLILVNNPNHNQQGDFGLTEQGFVSLTPKHYTFTGIACYCPDVFGSLKPGRYSIRSTLLDLVSQGKVRGSTHHGVWIDVGSAERLALISGHSREGGNPFLSRHGTGLEIDSHLRAE